MTALMVGGPRSVITAPTLAFPERRRNYASLQIVATEFGRRTGRTTGGARQRIYHLREDSVALLQSAVATQRFDFVSWFFTPIRAVVDSAEPVQLELGLVESATRCYAEACNALLAYYATKTDLAAGLFYRAAELAVAKLQLLMRAIVHSHPGAML